MCSDVCTFKIICYYYNSTLKREKLRIKFNFYLTLIYTDKNFCHKFIRYLKIFLNI